MPALKSWTLADGQTTPSNYVFVPRSVSNGTILFADTLWSAGLASKEKTMAITTRVAQKTSDQTIMSAAFRWPIVDANNAPLFYDQIRIEGRFGFGSALVARTSLFAFVKNFLADADAKTWMTTPEGMW
jgi:hypothetical protein